MAGLTLSPEDRAHLFLLMRRQLNSAVHRRVNVLLLLDDGWSVARIASALYLDASTVAEHRALSGTPAGGSTISRSRRRHSGVFGDDSHLSDTRCARLHRLCG